MSDDFVIRTMSEADIERAVEWAAVEGWNPGTSDAICFASVDPQGFFGGWLGDRMIASISVVNYTPDFAFLGFYIVEPSSRGLGYGYRLWQHAVRHAGNRLIGLDGVPAEQDNYRRSGFELAYGNIRFGGNLSGPSDIPHATPTPGLEITPLAHTISSISEFDRKVFPAARDAFLNAWVSAPGHVARAALRDGKSVGYGVIRQCRNGRKIGPLFAEDRPVAETILAALMASPTAQGSSSEIFLDVPDVNLDAMALARDLGLQPVFETARMYTGPAPAIALDKIFGVSSFELG
jgi:GNAT superfamily N-acetyltransferase